MTIAADKKPEPKRYERDVEYQLDLDRRMEERPIKGEEFDLQTNIFWDRIVRLEADMAILRKQFEELRVWFKSAASHV